MKNYDHKAIEGKWQKDWEKKKVYKTKSASKQKKFYVLDMFPYPSGVGLHVGHPRGYIASDVYARQKRMAGYNVLHPMGYDAFGLPAEQYAIEHKINPEKAVAINVKTFEKQLSIIGLSYDWERRVNTTDPEYYKWTQWIFLQLFNSYYDTKKNKAQPIESLIKVFETSGNKSVFAHSGSVEVFSASEWKAFNPIQKQEILMQYRLAYEAETEVNWCQNLGTVLANDEIVNDKDGKLVSERGSHPVEKIKIKQWLMRITAYADRLLAGLEKLDWSNSIKEIQKNWIGKSEGSIIPFELKFESKNNKRKVLIGTRNEAKFRMVKECLPVFPDIDFVSLNDIPAVDDSMLVEGNDFVKNAEMKAEFYFAKTGIPTISTDNIFWIEKWKKDNGVMVHMRKESNPKSERATDEEVITFLQKWIKKVGGKSKAHFIYAVAFADSNGVQSFSSVMRDYFLQAKQSENFWPGYPTESLLIDAKTKEYKGEQKNEVRYDKLISELQVHASKWFSQPERIEVFTTRADTLFGATYVVLAPEHELVSKLKEQISNWTEVEAYIAKVKDKEEQDRVGEGKEKTGVELKGVTAINPANGDELPVWIADYVLAQYGTGAVMAVPAHDQRDYEFAKKYNLGIRQVVLTCSDDTKNPPKEGLPEVKRETIIVFLRDNSTGKYALLNWHGTLEGITTGIMGGVEEGQTPEDAVLAEIREEASITGVKIVKKFNWITAAKYCASHKNQNRCAVSHVYIAEVENLKNQTEISEDEKKTHTLVWVDEDKVLNTLIPDHQKMVWSQLKNETALTEEGELINSDKFDGLTSHEARKKITEFVGGKIVVKYKMRDAIFARQRYWGEPIPLSRDKDGIINEVKKLPLTLPKVKSYEPTGKAEGPLAGVSAWVKAGYETNTMPGWAGSSWYFLRYMDPKNKKALVGSKEIKYWKNVDMYVGGAEHATGHLLYSRFWHKFLKDINIAVTEEPFQKMRNQGMILASDGRKMSKRWGNVINPDDMVKTYGADTLRIYEMFIGPFDQYVAWSTESIIGPRRFLERVWRLQYKVDKKAKSSQDTTVLLHKTIKKVTEDIEEMRFNTCVSALMILLSEMEKEASVNAEDYAKFLQILAPFAPHITEDLWNILGNKKSIHLAPWPKFNKNLIVSQKITIALQVNGKVRAELVIDPEAGEEEIKALGLKNESVVRHLAGMTPKRVIYVKNRLINIVV